MDDATLVQDSAQFERSLELSRRVDEPPSQVPGFEIERRLGEGAFGSVWLAREQNTGRLVAIKFYTHRRGLDWSLLNREVEKLAVLYTSRQIVRLLNVGWDHDPPYYVMEYLENGSLAAFLTQGALPPHEAVRIAKSVLHALVHAHGSGILHCDLKPANVLLDADFEPRLCDFGQSRLSDEQTPALGTLFYMAPEQADLKAVPDARWDVYALGALLYHMLTGEPPYRTEASERAIASAETLEQRLAVYRKIVRQSPRPSLRGVRGVDRRLAEIVERCLSVGPDKRYANAQAVLDELELRDRQRARRPLLSLGVIGPGLLLIAMAYSLYQFMQRAEKDAQVLLTTRAIESDVLSAQILARGVERDLKTRSTSLEQTAQQITSSESLRRAIENAAGKNREELAVMFQELTALKERSDRFRAKIGMRPDESWLVTDRSGLQVWREPYSTRTIGKHYTHRDYFHGQNREFPPGQAPPGTPPIREPHVSVPFTSDETNQYMFAISVPIWDPEHQEVIGVLARTMHLGKLLDEYGQQLRGDGTGEVERTLAIVECEDGKLIDHPWMTPERVKTLGPETFRQLKVPEAVGELLRTMLLAGAGANHANSYVEDYRDPVGRLEGETTHYGGTWLAAFAIIEGSNWAAIVQERRDSALDPVEEMKQGLVRYGFIALLLSCALIGVLWYFVGRALNDRSQPIWTSRNEGTRPTSYPTTPTDR